MGNFRFYTVLFFILMNIFSPYLYAKEYYIEDWQCFADLPQGITPIEITDTKATFSNQEETFFFQIKVYPHQQYKSASEIFEDVKMKINAEGEGGSFIYQGRDSVFADYSFMLNQIAYRGYSLLVNGDKYDWVILSFCEEAVYESFHFLLLSALDSFSVDETSFFSPGPVSSFYETSYGVVDDVKIEVPFEKQRIIFNADSHAVEASEVAAEREARVLSGYTASDTDAWSRFYRMIYRDNFSRVDQLFNQISGECLKGITDSREISERLLSWFQEFSYSRTGTIADFSPPLKLLKDYSGDCDSLALLYIMLLKRFGIDAILMVSAEYSHSMAAVDIEGKGARFNFNGKNYLVAEMTRDIAIGQIDAAMADPSKWLGIRFVK